MLIFLSYFSLFSHLILADHVIVTDVEFYHANICLKPSTQFSQSKWNILNFRCKRWHDLPSFLCLKISFIFTYLFLGCLFSICSFPMLIIILVFIIIMHVESMLSTGPSIVNFLVDWYSFNWIAFYTICAFFFLNNRLAAYITWVMYSFLGDSRCFFTDFCFGYCFGTMYVWAGSAGKCWLVCLFE